MKLHDLIRNDFQGRPRRRLEFWCTEDLPSNWEDYSSGYEHATEFSKGELIEEIPLLEWVCTDTSVGASAILWNDYFVAITLKECRKCETEWYWASRPRHDRMFKQFMTYATAANEPEIDLIGTSDIELDISSMLPGYEWQIGPERIKKIRNSFLTNPSVSVARRTKMKFETFVSTSIETLKSGWPTFTKYFNKTVDDLERETLIGNDFDILDVFHFWDRVENAHIDGGIELAIKQAQLWA